MKRKIIISAAVVFLLIIGAYMFNDYYHSKIKEKPLKYCYQTYFGPPNSVLIIEDLSYKDSLVNYYEKMANGENPVFNFPLKTLPQFDPVYVVDYTEDSLLAKVVSYYNRGNNYGGSYLSGYVYVKTLHDNPPPKKEN